MSVTKIRPSLAGRRPVPLKALIYVGRGYVFSFFVAFLFFFVIFFVNQILLLAEDILSKQAPLGETLLLLVYSLPSIIAIAFPFSSLAGALMTSAGLNSDREILAFSAAGFSPRTIYAPFILIGLASSLISFSANDYFLPRSSAAFRSLYGSMVARSAALELKPYSIKRYSQATVVTGEKKGDLAGDLLIFETRDASRTAMIAAESAQLALDASGQAARIEMKNVLELGAPKDGEEAFSVTRADSMSYSFAIADPIVGFSGSNPSEMSSNALRESIDKREEALETRKLIARNQYLEARSKVGILYSGLVAGGLSGPGKAERDKLMAKALGAIEQARQSKPSDRSLQVFQLEYNKKFAIPAAGFLFSLLAFPLGLGTRKAGRTAGFGIALLISTLYWGGLFVGQTAGLRSLMSPALAMWLPNVFIILATMALWVVRILGSRRSL
ncbi:MAG TPA: LptF/LptG family permease [Rectinemataceae bacterium]